MAEAFGVNRSTIVAAMEELIACDVLESDFGGGTRVKSNTWSLLASRPPDWNRYIESGPFKANLETIRTINKLEFEPGYIRIGTGELSPSLYPSKLVNKDTEEAAVQDDFPELSGTSGPAGAETGTGRKALCRTEHPVYAGEHPDSVRFIAGPSAYFCMHAQERQHGLYGSP